MKPAPSSFRPILPGAVLIFAATAVTGNKLATRPSDAAAASQPPPAASSLPARRLTGKRQPTDEAQGMLNLIRQSRDPGERLQGTIALANSLSPSSFAMWFKAGWFNLHEGPELTVFTRIIMQRWKKEDPEGYLAWTLSSKSPEAARELSALMATSPEKALEMLRKYPDTATEGQALIELAKTHPDMAVDALRDFSLRNPTEENATRLRDLFHEMAQKDPAALEALIPSFGTSYRDVMTGALWEAKLKTSFTESLQQLWERPDGQKIFFSAVTDPSQIDSKFVNLLNQMPARWLAALAQNPYRLVGPENAEAWLAADLAGAGMSASQISNIHDLAISGLSQGQPEKALKLLDGPDISDSKRAQEYYQIFAGCWNDPEKQNALLASIQSEAGRAVAARTLETMENQRQARAEIENKESLTPENVMGKLADVKPQTTSVFDYLREMSSWDAAQVSAAASRFTTLPDDQQAAISKALLSTIRSETYSNPGTSELTNQAIVYTLNHPQETEKKASSTPDARGGMNHIVSTYVIGWSNEDPAAASSWVTTLPDGDAKTWALKNLARNWNRYDPGAVDQWIGKLPAGQRDEVRKYITPSK